MKPEDVTAEMLREQDVIKVDTGCARCGGHHDALPMKRLQSPVQIRCPEDGYTVTDTHWALCPDTGEPLLCRWEEGT